MFETFFGLESHGTDLKTEIIAGVTTFLTLSHILFVNPHILAATGMDKGAVFTATCVAAALATMMMALYANYPFALAPGMGMNAYFAYDVVGNMGFSWQVALGALFLSGILFLAISLSPLRQWIIDSIPRSQKMALSAGIGLFLIIIAFQNAQIIVADPATLVRAGDLTQTGVLLAVAGFFVMAAFDHYRISGGLLISILSVTLISVLLGDTATQGLLSMPPSLTPVYLELDIAGAFHLSLLSVVVSFFFVLLFDTTGSLIGLAGRAGMLDEKGNLPRMRQALVADSAGAALAPLVGTSPTTVYIESATGMRAGGRTGLTALVVAVLLALSLFFSPLAEVIPAYATAPAIFFVGCLMTRGLTQVDWDDVTEFAPAVVTALSMPLTYSITTGIGFGFISYVAIKVLSGKIDDVSPALGLLAVAFALHFAVL